MQNIKNKKTLYFISQFFSPDFAATGQLLNELTQLLSKNNFFIKVFTGMPSYQNIKSKAPRFELNKNIEIQRTETSKILMKGKKGRAINGILFCIRSFFKLISLSKKENVLVFTSEPPYLTFLGFLLNKIKAIPYIIIQYDLYPEVIVKIGLIDEKNLLINLWKNLNFFIYKNASEIIVLSHPMKKIILSYDKNLAKKIHVIPSWANNKHIVPIAKTDNWFVKKYNLENRFVVMYSGNQGRCHDLSTLIETAKMLKERKKIVFVFIGDGFQNKNLKKEKEIYELENCYFLPYQKYSDLPFSLSSADLAIVSLARGFESLVAPSKLYGHLTSATPIAAISPNNSYLKELIENEKFGLWFNNGENKRLSEWIIKLSKNPKLKIAYGERGLNFVNRTCTPKIITNRYSKIFSKYIDT